MFKSLFVPTPNVELFSNYYLVQLLAKERVKSIMEKTSFGNISEELVNKYLTIPEKLGKPEDIERYVKAEAKDVFASFKRFEEEKQYKQALLALKDYTGYDYEVTSVTMQGIMVLITVPEKE